MIKAIVATDRFRNWYEEGASPDTLEDSFLLGYWFIHPANMVLLFYGTESIGSRTPEDGERPRSRRLFGNAWHGEHLEELLAYLKEEIADVPVIGVEALRARWGACDV